MLDTPEKMLDVLSNEIIIDVINAPGNKSHVPDTRTLTTWEEAESRQLTAILEQLEDGGAFCLKFLDRYRSPCWWIQALHSFCSVWQRQPILGRPSPPLT